VFKWVRIGGLGGGQKWFNGFFLDLISFLSKTETIQCHVLLLSQLKHPWQRMINSKSPQNCQSKNTFFSIGQKIVSIQPKNKSLTWKEAFLG
jgi:hypothetical protein